MEKRTYIQPKCEAMILPKYALMAPQPLAGSPTGPTVGVSAPARLAPANPVIANDTVPVF